MGIVIFGTKSTIIGIDEFVVNCPTCEEDNVADIMVTSNYYHIYYVPMFPFEKEANIVCQKCGLGRYNVPFDTKVVSNIPALKTKFKHPWYTYAFITVLTVAAASAFLLPKKGN